MNSTSKLLCALAAALTLAACSTQADTAAGTPVLATIAPSASSAPAVTSPTTVPSAAAPEAASTTAGPTPIRLTVGNQSFDAVLNDTQVSRDFLETLPRTLPWFRNSGIEYITELDAPLTETGPFYTDVQPGDLVYYNPLDSLTIIYEETSSVPTLTKMGEVTSNLAAFRDLPDNIDIRIERG